jgi:hypothetical protein
MAGKISTIPWIIRTGSEARVAHAHAEVRDGATEVWLVPRQRSGHGWDTLIGKQRAGRVKDRHKRVINV